MDEIVFEGNGGTCFNAAIDAFSLKEDNRIKITDGMSSILENR